MQNKKTKLTDEEIQERVFHGLSDIFNYYSDDKSNPNYLDAAEAIMIVANYTKQQPNELIPDKYSEVRNALNEARNHLNEVRNSIYKSFKTQFDFFVFETEAVKSDALYLSDMNINRDFSKVSREMLERASESAANTISIAKKMYKL